MEFLLVDDNETSLELEKIMLESCGAAVETADGGERAVILAKQKHYAMIFMDIRMPGMDGFTAAERIREFDQNVSIIAVSADEIPPTDPRFMAAGMTGFLKKPMKLSDLRRILTGFVSPESTEGGPWRRRTDVIFDYEELLSVMRDEKAVYNLLQQFLKVHSGDGDLLAVYVADGNYRQARAIMHNLLGISGSMFCRRLYTISNRLYEELKQEQPRSLEAFLSVWKATIGEISECCSHLAPRTRQEAAPVRWEPLWADFMGLCRDFDIAAADLFLKNVQTFETHLSAEDLGKLRNAIVRYDFLWILEHMEG